jgi:hypothetical protein
MSFTREFPMYAQVFGYKVAAADRKEQTVLVTCDNEEYWSTTIISFRWRQL